MAAPAAPGHRIEWWVYVDPADPRKPRVRRTATMRGRWPGYDVTCTCGWQTTTGGAVRSYIEQEVWSHKFEVATAADTTTETPRSTR